MLFIKYLINWLLGFIIHYCTLNIKLILIIRIVILFIIREQTDKKFERIEKEVLEDIYKCKHCELSFKTIQKLKKHIKQHSNKHNFQQNIPEVFI